MKKLILPVLLLTLAVGMLAQPLPKEILGVYKYQLEDQEGLSIISPTHFIWVIYDKNRVSNSKASMSLADKVKAYNANNAAGGTHSYLGEKQVEFTFSIHSTPQNVGNSFVWTYEKKGDLLHFWILSEDGTKGPLMKSKKIADWNAPGLCSDLNGTWTYEEWSGLYLQCGNYGVWTIHFQDLDQVNTDEEKAKAFDVFNGTAAIGDCKEGGKAFWNVIHAWQVQNEGQSIGTQSQNLKDKSKWFLLNANGKEDGLSWHITRTQ